MDGVNMYGNFDELLMNAENGIRKSRKNLRDAFQMLQSGHIIESMGLLKEIDSDLLNSLSSYSTLSDDVKSIDGITDIKPTWAKN